VPTSYGDACALILGAPAPVLYLDTCIFLDIVRAPVRENISSESASLAQELRTRSCTNPRSIWLVTSETVQTEWHDNIDEVKTDVERNIRKLESKRRHFLSAAQAVTGSIYPHGQIESALNLLVQLEAASEALLDACVIVTPDDAHLVGAMNRVKSNRPPAKRGKAEPKDCEIYELFFSLCRDLRAGGMTEDFVFASSNINEFGTDNSGGVQLELSNLNAKYSSDIPWAVAAIDGRT